MTETLQPTEPPHPDPLPEEEGEMRTRFSRKQLFAAIKWALVIATIIFVAIALAKQLHGFDWRNFHPNLIYILGAALCIAMVTIMQIIAYRLLLAAYGPTLTWPQAATLSWVPGLAKYIPGKVVAIGGTVFLLRKYKVSAPIALSVALMGDAVAVLTGLIAGAPLLLTPQAQKELPGGVIWCVLMVVGGLVCLYPPVFTRLVNVALRKLKRQELSAIPHLQYYLLPVLAGFGQWICWGCALWFQSRSIGYVGPNFLPRFVLISALANTIAYLVIFAPGGVGFREIFLFIGLDPLIGHANAAIVVVALRIVQTLVEIVLFGVGMLILRRSNTPEHAG